MKRVFLFLFTGVFLLSLLAACVSTGVSTSKSADEEALETAQASNPLPTQMTGLKISSSTACLVRQDVAVSISDEQGDQLAWSPTTDELAYTRPSNDRWAWFVGQLVIYDVGLNKEMYTSNDLEVFGDMTWAPDASAIAYVVLDSSQRTYTVHVLNMSNGGDTDIFAGTGAKTDDWSSTKGVTGWVSERNVEVTSSCGLDCARKYDYNTETSVLTAGEEVRKSEAPSLVLTNETASADGLWTTAEDTRENFWLSNTKTGKAFMLLEGKTPQEMKWSKDSRYLALRTEDTIYIYQMGCRK